MISTALILICFSTMLNQWSIHLWKNGVVTTIWKWAAHSMQHETCASKRDNKRPSSWHKYEKGRTFSRFQRRAFLFSNRDTDIWVAAGKWFVFSCLFFCMMKTELNATLCESNTEKPGAASKVIKSLLYSRNQASSPIFSRQSHNAN